MKLPISVRHDSIKRCGLAVAAILAIGGASFAQVPPANAPPSSRTDPTQLPKVFAARIQVGDLTRSAQFYRQVFDAKVLSTHAHEMIAQLSSGPGIILVQRAPDTAAAAHGAGGFIIQVTDIEGTVARVKSAGGIVERPPNDGTAKTSFGTRSALVRDPDGVSIEIIQFLSR